MTVLASLHIDGIQRAALLIVAMVGAAAHVAADVGIGVLPAHEKIPLQSNFFRRYPAKLSCPADRLAIRPENPGNILKAVRPPCKLKVSKKRAPPNARAALKAITVRFARF